MLDLPPFSPSSPGTLRAYPSNLTTSLNITVLGAGAFGQAFAILLSRSGLHKVKVLDVVQSRIEGMNTVREDGKRYNPDFLKECPLPDNCIGVFDPSQAFINCDIVFSAIPIQFCFDYLTTLKPFMLAEKKTKPLPFVSLSKGIALTNLELIHQVFERVWDIDCKKIAEDSYLQTQNQTNVTNNSTIFANDNAPTKAATTTNSTPSVIPVFVSGPSFAEEVGLGLPTAFTCASPSEEYAVYIAEVLNADSQTVCHYSSDYIGVELAGALKNVYAIGAGVIQGLYQERYNTFSLYITLAAQELNRICQEVWSSEPITGFSGMGDLILSCTGPSRNRSIGFELATTKKSASELLKAGITVEGVATCKALHSILLEKEFLRQCPIVRAIYAILYANQPVQEAFEFLFSLPVQRQE